MINNIQSQVSEAVRQLGTRNGFPPNSLNVDVQFGIMDEYQIRIRTYIFQIQYSTTIRLSPYMLEASRMGQAPMIIEHLEQGIRSLKDHILGYCSPRPTEGYERTHAGWEPVGDPAPAQVPQTPYRSTPIVSPRGGEKIKEFKEFLLEMKRDLKEGYDISMLDIIDKFDETFEEE